MEKYFETEHNTACSSKDLNTVADPSTMFNFLKSIDPTISCSKCGGTVPVGSNYCTYCGTKHDRDLALLKYGVEQAKSDSSCPECKSNLESIDLEIGYRFLVERCQECYGVFFEKLELEEFLKSIFTYTDEPDIARLNELLSCPDRAPEKVKYRNCPVCNRMMRRKNFGQRTGVIIDVCQKHGTWLDGGELSHLMKWAAAGGQQSRCSFGERKTKLEREAKRRNLNLGFMHLKK